jgi:RHS repeat-associated protein
VQDAETDLVYMQQRYYDPIAGRFLSVDPVVTDAETGKLFGRYH